MKFRKKPIVIEAFRLGQRGEPTPAPEWFPSPPAEDVTPEGVIIHGLYDDCLARWGDWIIKGLNGGMGLHACSPEIFERNYEPVP